MSLREEADGVLAALPERVPPIDPGVAGLVRAIAGPTPLLVDGRRAHARISGPPSEPTVIHVDGRAVLRLHPAAGVSVANVLLAPGLARRELVGSFGHATECLLVAPSLPLIWIQYVPSGAHLSAPGGLVLDPATLGPSPEVLAQARSGLLFDAGEGRAVLVAAPGVRVAVESGSTGRLSVAGDAELPALTLLLAVGTPSELKGALSAAPHARAHAARATSGPLEGLAVHTGVKEIDDGLAWARARLEGITARRPSVLAGLGALAASDEESARRTLASLGPTTVEHALLAGRLAATFGDPGPAARAALTLSEVGSAGPTELLALAASALAEGLRFAAPPSRIAELSAMAATPVAPAPAGRSLPMAGPSGRPAAVGIDPEEPWLRTLLAGNPTGPPGGAGGPDAITLRRAAATFATDPDAAWRSCRQVLRAGLRGGPCGPATWDPADPTGKDCVTAELVLALVHGMLGLAVDAPVGRLRLAPRLPSHLSTFAVGGLALGSARLRLDYQRRGPLHRFTVTPEHAAVPPLLVLEPTVSGRVRATRVDGELADLDTRPVGESTLVPVQLPVEGTREVEVEVGP